MSTTRSRACSARSTPPAGAWRRRAAKPFRARLTRDAEADLERQFDFVLQRERARGSGDLTLPEQTLIALRSGIATLKSSPFTCRKVGRSPFLCELIVPFGRSGCLVLFEIEDAANVVVARHPAPR